MRLLELFSGTGNMSRIFEERGAETLTVDYDPKMNADLDMDIRYIDPIEFQEKYGWFDVIWASPECTTFSVMSLRHYWEKDGDYLVSKSEKADNALLMVENTLNIIEAMKPHYYFIENPRAGMRKLKCMEYIPRRTVTYCQYGHDHMKPTDIWTNCEVWENRPPCKNGDPCHIRSPRGSHNGVQSNKSRKSMKIPDELCIEVRDACYRGIYNE